MSNIITRTEILSAAFSKSKMTHAIYITNFLILKDIFKIDGFFLKSLNINLTLEELRHIHILQDLIIGHHSYNDIKVMLELYSGKLITALIIISEVFNLNLGELITNINYVPEILFDSNYEDYIALYRNNIIELSLNDLIVYKKDIFSGTTGNLTDTFFKSLNILNTVHIYAKNKHIGVIINSKDKYKRVLNEIKSQHNNTFLE